MTIQINENTLYFLLDLHVRMTLFWSGERQGIMTLTVGGRRLKGYIVYRVSNKRLKIYTNVSWRYELRASVFLLQIFFVLECTWINTIDLVLKGKCFQTVSPKEQKSFVMNYVTLSKQFCVLDIQIIYNTFSWI